VKARILPLDSDEHRVAQELLPWLVNGTLEADEAAQVTAHVAQCARCQADVASQASLRSVAVDDVSRESSVERGWAAMRRRLDRAAPEAARRAPAKGRSWWMQGLQIAFAVQAVVVLVLAVALVGESSRGEPYRALGAAPSAVEANALAVFRADATEQQMRAALRATGARIVGGPTVTDAYLLRLSDPSAPALARLRAQPGVLRVESLQGEAAR
jgi:hypothetical protein